jgi:anti-sigma factor RsiW
MNELSCAEFVELVTAYLDGALEAPDEQRIAEHLALCDGCDRYLEQFRHTISALGDVPAERLGAEARSALLAAFRDQKRM